jgi:hypothetical protein|tara:strand:+ start:316 stop:813 length:498 start_codon:yes stop_codon:yes gene_type:complete
MWIVAKINKNQQNFFIEEVLKKKKDIEIYQPKYKLEDLNNRKKIKIIKKPLFNDYLFLNLKNFNNETIYQLNFCKGLKYFLKGFESSQLNIKKFIDYCKSFEDGNNFIKSSFFKNLVTNKGKFIAGPFKGIIFDIIKKNKNYLDIRIGNFKTSLNERKILYDTVN